jgi:hypothetical protein
MSADIVFENIDIFIRYYMKWCGKLSTNKGFVGYYMQQCDELSTDRD